MTCFLYVLRESELGEEGFIKLHSAVKRGDIVGVVGSPGLKLTMLLYLFWYKNVLLSRENCLFFPLSPLLV